MLENNRSRFYSFLALFEMSACEFALEVNSTYQLRILSTQRFEFSENFILDRSNLDPYRI